ncbi:uncharacterized protein LOC129716683 [Wyeomyia smithii]|uniref:uncharacterized protein LOC129716683 n=1 Tax=Wyeomyia smithii TaxID=174621 RepID=UPI0024681BE1|nr:uncharacterized protein LOC129716683 [Wyeomyia smithii]
MCRDVERNLITSEREVVDRWHQFFAEHLNSGETEGGGREVILGVPTNDSSVPVPGILEIKREIGSLKSNRAAGMDRLPAELYKHGKEALAVALHWVISRIWEEERLPEEWMEVVCPVYKKGDRLQCSNYRGMTLINAAFKVLSQILLRRLSPLAKEFVG